MHLSNVSLRITVLSVFVLAFLGLCSKAEGQAQEARGEIRVVESFRPDINVLGHNVLQYLYEYALDRNELVPCLAVSRRWIDDTTLELKLREGVRFHNGEPFDAGAVKFNFEYQREHSHGRGVQAYMRHLKEVQILDPYTFRMILSEPDALFLDKIILGPIAGWAIGAPRYMEQVGWDEFLKRPIGTGPYVVEGEVKDYMKVGEDEVYATLVANSAYWNRGYPKIRRVKFVQYTPKEALYALMEERVDLVTSLIPKDTLRIAESPHSKVIKGREDAIYTAIWFNLMSPHTLPLRDMRVRKALNYVINKEELMRYAYKGNALEMRGMLTEKSGVDLSETDPYEWNVSKARELLQWAGYDEGLMMTLFYQEKDYLLARFIQRFYQQLKIDVDIIPVQWEWFVRHQAFPNIREDYSWEDEDWWMCVSSNPSYIPEIMGGLLEWNFHSGAAWQTVPDWLMLPLNRMYNELLRTTDKDKRFHIYKKANEYIADQALSVFTVTPLGLYGINKELNFIPHPSQYLYLDYSSVTDRHWSIEKRTTE